jgi:hypothetical protein
MGNLLFSHYLCAVHLPFLTILSLITNLGFSHLCHFLVSQAEALSRPLVQTSIPVRLDSYRRESTKVGHFYQALLENWHSSFDCRAISV